MTGTYRIARLGHRGDGVTECGLFAPRTLPGEEVTGTLDGSRLTDIRILTPSPSRVSPPCRHYAGCGGCQVMHATDEVVADWKRQIVIDALAARGLEAEVARTETSPPRSRRRATFAVRRTKKGALAGFHTRASDTIVAIPDCQVLTDRLRAALPMVEALGAVLCSRKGEAAVTVTDSVEGLDVFVSGGKVLDGPTRAELGALAGRFDLARLTCGDEPVAAARPPYQTFGTVRVVPPPGAFLQATAHGESALVEAVREGIGDAARVVDLFAGSGTFTFPLASGAAVHAVEGDRAMMAAVDAAWRKTDGLKRVTTETRDLFRRPLEPDELQGFDAAVIDPPRAGAEAQIARLAEARLPRIAHVSCNPATFARDAATLAAAGYAMGPVRVVDQFRWSAHVELAATFTLA
ncbi:class I SAM-dependent RNA methyltransferase [Pseudaestuariivita atlantica]|uniref:RNA methyltransferase n=1 Tax=Pseudaestuariivita atlantica TaxID=1317121 RepID=A0A0L1JPI8_9RHOB|nr:RsmD family RNA methyltransferase [Pseudaestuariivita atlantica]KNG93679.1 RNA methyltransferase [Pseudaestuariivita atlantica]